MNKKKALLKALKADTRDDVVVSMYGVKIEDMSREELIAIIDWFGHELRRVKRMTELRSDAEIRLSLSTFV